MKVVASKKDGPSQATSKRLTCKYETRCTTAGEVKQLRGRDRAAKKRYVTTVGPCCFLALVCACTDMPSNESREIRRRNERYGKIDFVKLDGTKEGRKGKGVRESRGGGAMNSRLKAVQR